MLIIRIFASSFFNEHLCSARMDIEQRSISLLWSSPRTRDTHTYCRAFSYGAVTICFHDLALLLLGFEHTIVRLLDERSIRLRHRRGL